MSDADDDAALSIGLQADRMLVFSVYKASKYLFDCMAAVDTSGSQQQQQTYPNVRVDEMEALGIDSVNIVKRLDFTEVDRMIACCRQHPPQLLVAPATNGDMERFRAFAKYLKDRRRAGVGTLPNGCLLLLSPLENDEMRLRCVAVEAKPGKEHPASISSSLASVRIDANRRHGGQQGKPSSKRPPESGGATEREQHQHRRHRHQEPPKQQEQVGRTTQEEPLVEEPRRDQAGTSTTAVEMVTLDSLPRLERATFIAQLRQQYEAFNGLHYDVLDEWSSKDPDY